MREERSCSVVSGCLPGDEESECWAEEAGADESESSDPGSEGRASGDESVEEEGLFDSWVSPESQEGIHEFNF